MNREEIDYKTLCHRLEYHVDRAITCLEEVDHPAAETVRFHLLDILTDTEEAIIKEYNNIIAFPLKKEESH